MKKGALLALFGVLGALLLAVSGCGGGDEETTSVTREEFVNQANKVCKRGQLEREDLLKGAEKLATQGGELPDSAKEEVMITTFVDPYKKMIGELQELDLPEKGRQDFEKLLATMEKSEQEGRRDPLVLIQSISQYEDANELARKIGLDNCAV